MKHPKAPFGTAKYIKDKPGYIRHTVTVNITYKQIKKHGMKYIEKY